VTCAIAGNAATPNSSPQRHDHCNREHLTAQPAALIEIKAA
jgi:hypothetical protein